MKPLSDCQLYAFVDTAYLAGRSVADLARELCEGGADLIQLRAKTAPLDEVRWMAGQIAPITSHAGVHLVINDYPAIAAAVGAPLVHLGQEDFFDAGYTDVGQVRAQTQAERRSAAPLLVGLSTHAPDQAARAMAAGADYIAIGPVFPTGTKPTARPVTLDYVRWAAAHVRCPWFAIGGITLENLDPVMEAGARRICVVSAILKAPNVTRACQAFKDRLLSARRENPES